ncbi:MAG: cytochrome P450 [Anaerolineales bacterium]|jgi:cytochrome P450
MSRRPPSLDGLPLIGNLLEARRDPLRFVLKMAAVPSNLVHYRIGPYTGYLINHPDDIQYILRKNFQNYSKENYDYKVLKPVLGEGLLTASGDHWRRQRRVIQPAFHRKQIEAFGSKATTATLEMLARWQTDFAQGQPIDLAREMSCLTLRIIGEVLFGTELHGEDRRVASSFQFLNTDVSARLKTAFAPPLWVPTPRNIKFRRARAELDSVVYTIIEGRRQSGPAKGDLLDLLLAARGQEASSTGMTTRQLRDEVMTFMLAGHETTATALTWFWYLLAKHPEKAHQSWYELEEVLGGRTPKVSDLPALGYLDRLIHEVLRLYPPVWIISRKALAEDEIGGYPVPPGTVVLLCQYAMHRHPAFWENPKRFDPDRFSPQRSRSRHPFAYFPFGGGPRLCIGNHLAMMEIKLIAATIAQRYRLDLVSGHPVEAEPLITLRPRYGMKARLHPRGH